MATKLDVMVFLVTALALGTPFVSARRDLLESSGIPVLSNIQNAVAGKTVTLVDIPGLKITCRTETPSGGVPSLASFNIPVPNFQFPFGNPSPSPPPPASSPPPPPRRHETSSPPPPRHEKSGPSPKSSDSGSQKRPHADAPSPSADSTEGSDENVRN